MACMQNMTNDAFELTSRKCMICHSTRTYLDRLVHIVHLSHNEIVLRILQGHVRFWSPACRKGHFILSDLLLKHTRLVGNKSDCISLPFCLFRRHWGTASGSGDTRKIQTWSIPVQEDAFQKGLSDSRACFKLCMATAVQTSNAAKRLVHALSQNKAAAYRFLPECRKVVAQLVVGSSGQHVTRDGLRLQQSPIVLFLPTC